jgi:glutathione S-transferase
MSEFTLISHHLCPYVQRAAIALDEKGVAFERVMVDLSDKPGWFQEISPLGKVPLLRVRPGEQEDGRDTLLFESAVILEYLEDSQPRPLHPAEPLARARHRAWIEFGSALLAAIWRFYSAIGDVDWR